MRLPLALVAMALFGLGVYFGLGSLRSHTAEGASTPTGSDERVDLPGTIYLAQQGTLYRLSRGKFTELHPGPGGRWLQPAVSPDGGSVLAVDRGDQFSDIYQLDRGGHVLRRLTDNSGGKRGVKHWAFYPSIRPDGQEVLYSYDAPKYPGDFKVDMALWTMAVDGTQRTARQLSTPNPYTGGDVAGILLRGGGVLYAKYGINNNGAFSQVWYQARRLSAGTALTPPGDDCQEPSLAADGTRLVMVCTHGRQSTDLEFANLDADGNLGPRGTLVSGLLCASPVWSPDAGTIAFLSPAGPQGHFQLWTVGVSKAGTATTPPKQLTSNLDFDATSAPAWGSFSSP